MIMLSVSFYGYVVFLETDKGFAKAYRAATLVEQSQSHQIKRYKLQEDEACVQKEQHDLYCWHYHQI